MGDTDGYVGGMALGGPAVFLALPALALRLDGSRSFSLIYLVAGIPPLLLLILVVPWFGSATISGHHLCGATYDSYLPYTATYTRYLPLIHLVFCLSLVAVCFNSARGDRRAT